MGNRWWKPFQIKNQLCIKGGFAIKGWAVVSRKQEDGKSEEYILIKPSDDWYYQVLRGKSRRVASCKVNDTLKFAQEAITAKMLDEGKVSVLMDPVFASIDVGIGPAKNRNTQKAGRVDGRKLCQDVSMKVKLSRTYTAGDDIEINV